MTEFRDVVKRFAQVGKESMESRVAAADKDVTAELVERAEQFWPVLQ